MDLEFSMLENSLGTAIKFLAHRDDRATSRDDIGFNKFDTGFGQALAAIPEDLWTSRQKRAAWKLLKKYQAQLQRANIDFAAIPEPPESTNQAIKTISLEDGRYYFKFPFNWDDVNAIKALPERKYDPTPKTWSAKANATNSAAIAQLAQTRGFTLTTEAAEKISGIGAEIEAERVADEKAKTDAKVAIEAATAKFAAERAANEEEAQRRLMNLPDLTKPLSDGKVLFEHQRDGIARMVHDSYDILADDMGLGKTIQALLAARVFQLTYPRTYVFVVAPVSLRDNWREAARVCDVRIEIFSWAKIPEYIEDSNYVLICDEAHYAQNIDAKRTQKMLAIAEHAKAVFLLTGTPIKNGRPAGLYPLLVAVKHPLAADRKHYETHFCDAKAKPWTKWNTTGAAHLDELHERTKDVLIRRTKKQCLDLPEKTRVLRAAELSEHAQEVYDQTFAKLRQNYRERLSRGEIKSGGEALVELNHLRHAGSIGKTETAIELAEEIVEEKQQAVIFVAFKDAGDEIRLQLWSKGIDVEYLTGETDVKDRQPMIDRFQAGKTKVLICSFGAGGVGITLTAAQTVILVDRPWTSGDALQAEDRLHRIGQYNPVTAIWLQTGEIDEAIDQILQAKQDRINLVLGGKRKTMRGIASPGEIANELMPILFGDDPDETLLPS